MYMALRGAGSQSAVHAEALAGGAQDRQQQNREGVEEQYRLRIVTRKGRDCRGRRAPHANSYQAFGTRFAFRNLRRSFLRFFWAASDMSSLRSFTALGGGDQRTRRHPSAGDKKRNALSSSAIWKIPLATLDPRIFPGESVLVSLLLPHYGGSQNSATIERQNISISDPASVDSACPCAAMWASRWSAIT